ncbi:MAG: hypothetical protein AAF610_08300 [Pseudomonadota bacterium]
MSLTYQNPLLRDLTRPGRRADTLGRRDMPTRFEFDTREDARQATMEVARTARRAISIFSDDLEPWLYGTPEFAELAKNLILTHKFARVRVLIKSPVRCVCEGHRLIELARRFSTFMEIRVVEFRDQKRPDAFLVSDQRGMMHRALATRYDGTADLRDAAGSLRLLEFFDTAWNRASRATELQRLYL